MRTVVAAVAMAVAMRPAAACLWDYDTLGEESLGQADVAAAVGGDLHKHSNAFYAAKVDYTRAIVDKGDAAKERYDDLAVALAKTGKLDDALAVLADKDTRFPGEYTTEANRGTVLAMKGDVAGALDHLNKAVAINPDAHFGREIYQLKLLDYRGKLAKDSDLATRENFLGIHVGTWAGESGVITKMDKPPNNNGKHRVKVPTAPVVAIVGLMRFGDGQDDPHLWYALAWAFVDQGDAQLALRAFRRAELLGHPRAGDDGTVLSGALHELRLVCCRKPDDPQMRAAWTKLSARFDAEWKRGAAADEKRQRGEDARVAKKQYKAVFGY
jgi:tetratricopeptide (TPR) repeat protein